MQTRIVAALLPTSRRERCMHEEADPVSSPTNFTSGNYRFLMLVPEFDWHA